MCPKKLQFGWENEMNARLIKTMPLLALLLVAVVG